VLLFGLCCAKNKLGGHNQTSRTTRLKERRHQDSEDVNTRRKYSRNNILMAKSAVAALWEPVEPFRLISFE